MNAIELNGLSKIYRSGFWGKPQLVLDQVSFTVPAGTICGFLGANGAGKTTAIKILMGLQFASSGRCRMFGSEIDRIDVKARVGYLPERPYFHEGLTARRFLDFHRGLFGRALKGKKLASNEELLELVGIPDTGDKLLRNFSKGMLQRIGIAQALVNDPDLVVLDEPLSGLDPVGRKEVRDLIFHLGREGKTVFFSSHVLSDVEQLCQQLVLLEKGRLKLAGSVEDLVLSGTVRHEVHFTGLSPEKLSGVLACATGQLGRHVLYCGSREEARDIMQEIWQRGGTVLSYAPEHRSLEQMLFGRGNV